MPTFTIGMNDGIAIRDLIARAGGETTRISIRLDAGFVPGLKTATVWGTLPGTTDETISPSTCVSPRFQAESAVSAASRMNAFNQWRPMDGW